jgi:AcrR family transcriptional regulator
VDQRTKVLVAAEKLLDASPDRDISTRAVCAAAGIGAPMLYRLFGDKNGLLSALVDYGFDRHLAAKRDTEAGGDPVEDLRNGWDSHVAFARAHPAVYRLMYSPHFAAVPQAAGEALRLLKDVLVRCAADGLLRMDIDAAAQTVMSANIGVALSLVTQPDTYADPELSRRIRDAVHRSILTGAAFDEQRSSSDDRDPDTLAVTGTATRLDALLSTTAVPLSDAETALLREWLHRLRAA